MKPKRFMVLLVALALVLSAGLAFGQDSCTPTVVKLIAGYGHNGPGTEVGSVTVIADNQNIYVTYQTLPGYYITETHVAICDTAFTDRPTPGLSYYTKDNLNATEVTQVIPFRNANHDCINVQLHPECASCAAQHTDPPDKNKTCPVCLDCGDTIYIAAHANVTGPSSFGSQTAYGGTCTPAATDQPNDQSWFCQFPYKICCGEQPPPQCEETAWGYGTNQTGDFAQVKCFRDLGFSNWGWTNQISITTPGTYTMILYAGAGLCDLDKGTPVGTVTVLYNGTTATVNYTPYSGFSFTETHVWIGKDYLPKLKTGYTTAPGQFPYKDGAVQSITAPFWVAAHAKVAAPCPSFAK